MISSFSRLAALSTFALSTLGLSSLAHSADKSSRADAPVPTVTYRSVFRETSLGVEQERVDWRKSNNDVGKFTRGHVDILKQEEMDTKAMPPKALPAKPTTPAASHKH
jgi:hypothetical protein